MGCGKNLAMDHPADACSSVLRALLALVPSQYPVTPPSTPVTTAATTIARLLNLRTP